MLLHNLPEPNWELLRAFTQFLRKVVDNQEKNKMNMSNGEGNPFMEIQSSFYIFNLKLEDWLRNISANCSS